jgi:anti-sigma factor RsiW
MNHCPETLHVQDWLDGELAPAAAARFEAHLVTCALCEAEVASFRVVFSELRAVPLLDPRPELFNRIMDEVLPHSTPRWVKVMGWGYAASIAVSLGAIGSAFVLPGPGAWVRGIIAAGTRALTETGTYVVLSTSEGLSRFGETLAGSGAAGRMLKLMWGALAHPAVFLTLLAAVGVCAAVLWWMRPRERRSSEEIPHVGLLGL